MGRGALNTRHSYRSIDTWSCFLVVVSCWCWSVAGDEYRKEMRVSATGV